MKTTKMTAKLYDIFEVANYRMPPRERPLFQQLIVGVRRAKKAAERLIELHGAGCECEYCYTLPGLLFMLRYGDDLIDGSLPWEIGHAIDRLEPRDD